MQFGKKIARFSIGVNVWQLNKYMIMIKITMLLQKLLFAIHQAFQIHIFKWKDDSQDGLTRCNHPNVDDKQSN